MNQVVTRLLALILLAALLAQGIPVAAQAAAEKGSVRLKTAGDSVGDRFAVENMYPGDSVSKAYEVTTVHNRPVTLHFRVDIHPEAHSEKNRHLRDQLWITVSVAGQQRYEGFLQEMPELTWALEAGDKKTEYEITLSLPTSAGNECAGTRVEMDFVWWYASEEDSKPGNPSGGKPGSPTTGDRFPLQLLLGIMGGAALLLAFLFLLRKHSRKEANHEKP